MPNNSNESIELRDLLREYFQEKSYLRMINTDKDHVRTLSEFARERNHEVQGYGAHN